MGYILVMVYVCCLWFVVIDYGLCLGFMVMFMLVMAYGYQLWGMRYGYSFFAGQGKFLSGGRPAPALREEVLWRRV